MKIPNFFRISSKNEKPANESTRPTMPQHGEEGNPVDSAQIVTQHPVRAIDNFINSAKRDFHETLPQELESDESHLGYEKVGEVIDATATATQLQLAELKTQYRRFTSEDTSAEKKNLAKRIHNTTLLLTGMTDGGLLPLTDDTPTDLMEKSFKFWTKVRDKYEDDEATYDENRVKATLALLDTKLKQRYITEAEKRTDEKIELLLKKQNIRPLTQSEGSELEIAIATQINQLSDRKDTAPLTHEQLQKLDALLSTYIDLLVRRKNTTGLSDDESGMLDALIEEKAKLFRSTRNNEELMEAA